MLGLFGALDLGKRSLQTQQQGVEVAGHNLANVNNPAYARQRVTIQTAPTIPTPFGPQGTGAGVVGIQQLRSALLDRQIQSEGSVTGFLEAQQLALQYAQADLGEQISRQSGTSGATDATQGSGDQQTLAMGLSNLFNAFQSLATDPNPGSAARLAVLAKAQSLASQFNQIDQRLASLQTSLNDSVETDVTSANRLLDTIANLNEQITRIELNSPGAANDLRDTRQQALEDLSKLVNITTSTEDSGAIDVVVAGSTLVSAGKVTDTLETYDAGSGRQLVRTKTAGMPLTLISGSIQGNIDARDGAVANLRGRLDSLASLLITEVNAVHKTGFSAAGTTGADFFEGTKAADISVNSALVADPSLIQASGAQGATGDNQVALALARLAEKSHASLGNQSFSQHYANTVGELGESLDAANGGLNDQQAVQNMLLRQRDSISGVSVDEEMTDLMKFQRAYQASAQLITTIDEMLQSVLAMKQ